MFTSVVISALSFSGAMRAPVARRASVSMAGTDAASQIGADVETKGFWDPLKFSQKYDFEKLRLAELKHGRAAMLATVGFFVQEFYRWPNSAGLFDAESPMDALNPENFPLLGLAQIFIFAGIIELRSKSYPGRAPGDIGFDPLGLSANGIREDYQLAELKNGRLAMVASIAFMVQTSLTGKGIIESTFDVFS